MLPPFKYLGRVHGVEHLVPCSAAETTMRTIVGKQDTSEILGGPRFDLTRRAAWFDSGRPHRNASLCKPRPVRPVDPQGGCATRGLVGQPSRNGIDIRWEHVTRLVDRDVQPMIEVDSLHG
ncbi:hypothetical protein Misp02_70870 [Microtetraspora sp. NBRC 16547]|nr:hypothetical protein Misp02_70870 [Microtetraspora sp. NBRC 16547]